MSTHHVNLVQDNDIRKLNLINHEIRNRSLILRSNVIPSSRQQVHRVKVMHHRKGINDRNRRIQTSKLLQPTGFLPTHNNN